MGMRRKKIEQWDRDCNKWDTLSGNLGDSFSCWLESHAKMKGIEQAQSEGLKYLRQVSLESRKTAGVAQMWRTKEGPCRMREWRQRHRFCRVSKTVNLVYLQKETEKWASVMLWLPFKIIRVAVGSRMNQNVLRIMNIYSKWKQGS